MARQKKKKFKEIAENPYVIEEGKSFYRNSSGKWNAEFFVDNKPIVIELGCGRGEYTIGMAINLPAYNYIGIDVKGDRIWKGAKEILDKNISNAGFLRAHAAMLIDHFSLGEVDQLWITFPDPHPKKRNEKHRLVTSHFFDLYKKILKPGGGVHLKTDNSSLFWYALEVINLREDCILELATWNLYKSAHYHEHYGIKTRYEKIFFEKGHQIKYLKLKFTE